MPAVTRLELPNRHPAKELKFNGVFRLTAAGKLDLLVKDMTSPNGLGFSPDEKKFYLANSDPARKVWMVYDLKADGALANGKVFCDVTQEKEQGLPDGTKLDTQPLLHWAGRNLGVLTAGEGAGKDPAAGVEPLHGLVLVVLATRLPSALER